MREKRDNQVKTEKYIGLSAVIILLLVLMFFVINLALFMRKANEKIFEEEMLHLEQHNNIHSDIIKRESTQDYFFTLLAEKDSLVENGLKKSKMPYTYRSDLTDIKEAEGHLILDGRILEDSSDLDVLKEFIDNEKTIIFLNMPERHYIKENNLEEMLGIGLMTEERVERELSLVPGFMLGGFHEFKDMSYKSIWVNLLATTKVYAFGKDQMPIIWRNTYKGSEIYVVNGPLMETSAAYGILTALLGEIYEDYIYPIINARLMTYDGFPYLSYENTENLEWIYNRDAMKLQNDILLPDILTINKRRDFIPNGFLAPGFEVKYSRDIGDYSINQINSTQKQLYKEGGEVGMKYSGDLEYDKMMYHTIFPNEEIKSILLTNPVEDLDALLEVSDNLEAIVGPWVGKDAFAYLDKHTVYIPHTMNGVDALGPEKLAFISSVTAFGASVQNLSLEDVVMVDGKLDWWKPISRSYMEFIDIHRTQFKFLKNRNITRTANATQVFRNTMAEIKNTPNKIEIRFEHWCGQSHYILKTNKTIKKIKNGTVKRIEEGIYLITATSPKVDIDLADNNR